MLASGPYILLREDSDCKLPSPALLVKCEELETLSIYPKWVAGMEVLEPSLTAFLYNSRKLDTGVDAGL